MDPDLLLILPTVLLLTASLGGFVLTGWRMWLRRPRGADALELTDHARDELRSIVRNEVAAMLESREGELEDLYERIDFAERLLIRARAPDEVLEQEATPA